ncbi:UNVERIFIED_CONTAM: hypothetical protein FKN15_056299 [Acipenser sinensis]
MALLVNSRERAATQLEQRGEAAGPGLGALRLSGTAALHEFTKSLPVRELVTPPLDGVILPGVTRQSLLDLARDWGEFPVSERRVVMCDFLTALKEGRVIEVFGAGTACVVCPVERVLYKGENYHIPTMENGPDLAKRFHKQLTDIQASRNLH